jgi:hypothetical protein
MIRVDVLLHLYEHEAVSPGLSPDNRRNLIV